MGKATTLSSAAKKSPKKTPAAAKSTAAKVKAPVKKASVIKNKAPSASVIGTKKRAPTKNGAPPPMPKGWPASSKLAYPVPQGGGGTVANPGDGKAGTEASDGPTSSRTSRPANYLTPGNLLQQSCNGSDVFLRKRAVQSASMAFPAAGAATKGGPARFLIVFPGRISLKAPPAPAPAPDLAGEEADGGNCEANASDEKGGVEGGGAKTKKNPFAPAHPPSVLGKLRSLGGDDHRMELRIPFPSPNGDLSEPSSASGAKDSNEQLVLSGRAIPLSGKYMALSFKRTGGSKDAGSSGGGAGGKGKKKGAGSIMCKDVFRSVIVLGDSKLLGGGGKTAESTEPVAGPAKDDGLDGVVIKHYGGSDRALDGGGKFGMGGASSGRKSLNGASASAAATRKRKDSVSSNDIDLESDGNSDDNDLGEENGDGSNAGSDDEFVPAAVRKRKSAGGSQKRKAGNESDDDAEEIAPARKRTPRRSGTTKVSYVDESSDADDTDDDNDEDEDEKSDARVDSDGEEDQPNRKVAAKKPAARAKPAHDNLKQRRSRTNTSVLNVDSDEEGIRSSADDFDERDAQKPKSNPKAKKPAARAKVATTARTAPKASAGRVSGRKKSSDDIVEVDSGSDDEDSKSPAAPAKSEGEVGEEALQTISADAKKKLSTLSSPQRSPSRSPISRGRRKKTSPKKSPPIGKENDLTLDDDPFSFL